MKMVSAGRWWWVSLLWVAPALAQPQRVDPDSSHVPIPRRAGQPDLEKVFEERFGRAMAIDDLARILEKLYPQHSRDQLLRDLKNSTIDWNDPQLRRQIAELAKLTGMGKSPLTPAEIEKLKLQFRDQLPNLPIRPPMGTGDGPIVNPPPMPPAPPGDPDRPGSGEPSVHADAGAREDAEEMLRWLSRRLERMADRMEESPTLRRLFREMSEGLLAEGMTGEGLDQQLARWNRWAREARGWAEPAWEPFRDLDMPRLRWGGTPNLGRGLPRIRSPREAVSAWPILAWAVVIGLVAWAVWKLGLPRLGRLVSPEGWRLGAWPVRPDELTSRQQLIQAFEYLSLLRFGLPARCWNHRQIARELGEEQAGRLASLYAHARYAPADEPLTPEQLASARGDLAELM